MSEVRDVIARVLEAAGALVEPVEPDGIEAVVPAAMREALDLPEFARLGVGEVLPEQASRVSLESEWMDTLGTFLGERGRFLYLGLKMPPSRCRSAGPEDMMKERLVFENATYRLKTTEHAWTHYLVLFLHIAAVSDEKREDILPVCMNESNRMGADHVAGPLLAGLRQGPMDTELPDGVDMPPPWTLAQVREWTDTFLPARVQNRVQPFLGGMTRRMTRDLERLLAYHTDLRREAVEKAASRRESAEAAAQRRAQRLAAIEREYRAKIRDLRRKYAITVDVDLIQALRVAMPVRRVHVNVLRRKGVRPCHLDWNPVSRQLDSLYCEACGAESPTQAVCDDRLHLLCPDCLADCADCGKPFCRACSPEKCPKCGASGTD